jgi:hypothetical protein
MFWCLEILCNCGSTLGHDTNKTCQIINTNKLLKKTYNQKYNQQNIINNNTTKKCWQTSKAHTKEAPTNNKSAQHNKEGLVSTKNT